MFKEFKKFAFKGNVLDMAVGVVIGGAFGKIVTSLVNDIITPLISLVTGGADFSEMFVLLNTNGADTSAIKTIAQAKEAGFATLNYGLFIQAIIDFFIIAFSIFLFIKLIENGKKKFAELEKKIKREEEEEAAAPEVKKPTQEELLEEIRDLLKENKSKSEDIK